MNNEDRRIWGVLMAAIGLVFVFVGVVWPMAVQSILVGVGGGLVLTGAILAAYLSDRRPIFK